MTADFEARHVSIGVGWDHHTQDAFIQLNWVTTEAKLWQAPAPTAQTCQKTLILILASRTCCNIYTEIVIHSHVTEWKGVCYNDHNHRSDNRPQNHWTAALYAWFHHVQQWMKEKAKHRQNLNLLFFHLSITSWRTIYKEVVVLEDQRPEMSHLLEHHLISRRQATPGSTFLSLSFIETVLNLNVCIESLISHSIRAWPLWQPSRWNTRFSYPVYGEKKCLYMKNGLSAIYSWGKGRNKFEHLGYRCNVKIDLFQEPRIATIKTLLVFFITYLWPFGQHLIFIPKKIKMVLFFLVNVLFC